MTVWSTTYSAKIHATPAAFTEDIQSILNVEREMALVDFYKKSMEASVQRIPAVMKVWVEYSLDVPYELRYGVIAGVVDDNNTVSSVNRVELEYALSQYLDNVLLTNNTKLLATNWLKKYDDAEVELLVRPLEK